MTPGIKAALIMYYAAVSITALITAFYDRNEVMNGRRGIERRNLIMISALGGAFWMFSVFLFTKHRTEEKLIMILLPLFIIIHTALATLMWLAW